MSSLFQSGSLGLRSRRVIYTSSTIYLKSFKLKVSATQANSMPKWFNIVGLCQEDIRYMLSAIARLPDLE
ncbi:MAG TPA: hypothetical protein DDZ80_31360 [Cyanobacteria bacterium UBA8803]|nr:hypothetical protein [Cyanobacteria bacterium UBA8803]